jgi:hypothetical protein
MALSALLFLYRRGLGYAMAAGVEFPEDYPIHANFVESPF